MSIKSKLNLFGGYFFRYIGFPIEPELRKIGNPNQDSPVLVTVNFNLTVNRVLKQIKGLDCYLLIAPSNGINVWCGACGDDFTTDSVISIIKTSKINELISHRTLILPQLSAPGIDPLIIKKEIGWKVKFGPVYAKDIKNYIRNNYIKTEDQKKVKFSLKKRLEMANIYFFMILLMFSIPYWIFAIFLHFLDLILYFNSLLLGISIVYGSFIILPSIPFGSGKVKVIIFGFTFLIFITLIYILFNNTLFYLIWNGITILLVMLMMTEDFHGMTPIYKSDLGEKTWKEGKEIYKSMFGSFKLQPYGDINLEREKCTGCKMCLDVCPRNVLAFNNIDNKVDLLYPNKCINCNACVKRCLAHCLEII